jgi:uncharacterized protein YndB with AHSA1/START domain
VRGAPDILFKALADPLAALAWNGRMATGADGRGSDGSGRLPESRFEHRMSVEEDGPVSNSATETLSVVVEREMAFPPEKIWRALTQPHLIEEWLMKNDFRPVVDHRFNFSANWGAVDCRVLAVEPDRTLTYTWGAFGLESVVTWTLTPTSAGTRLRMEQSGFRPDQQQAYQGAIQGWGRFFANLEQVLARMD